jgi:hypothetical protein
MDQQELRTYLRTLSASLTGPDRRILSARLESLVSVFPFSEYEYILSFLLDRRVVSFAEYEELRDNYVSDNRYLGLFGLAPRIFGQVWGETHLLDLDSRFVKPTRALDPDYDGQYDLILENVRVEIKAARAINTRSRGEIVSKALRYGSDAPFWMNFQQLKIDVCDVFVFIGVWVDRLLYWVLSNQEVVEQPTRSRQHRGGIEYQIGITHRNINQFSQFLVEVDSLADTALSKGRTV